MRFKQGFTLIEIMVAIVIMAVASSFLVVNLGQSNTKVLRLEARKAASLINHALDEAILTGKVLGFQLDSDGKSYRFVDVSAKPKRFGEADEDVKDGFMRARIIPENVKLSLNLLERKKKKNRSNLTPEKVIDLLNSSILDKASNVFDDKPGVPPNTIVVEPNGIIAPFELTLQADKESLTVKLNKLGKVVVIDPKSLSSR